MQILPAIDLRGGQCVRLRQGDYQQETVFGADPAAMARRWVADGADMLHIVDLQHFYQVATVAQVGIDPYGVVVVERMDADERE